MVGKAIRRRRLCKLCGHPKNVYYGGKDNFFLFILTKFTNMLLTHLTQIRGSEKTF